MEPQEHKLWPLFLRWCIKNQVSTTDHEEDWISFWDTWSDGFKTGYKVARHWNQAKRGAE